MERGHRRPGAGKLYVIGIGPGGRADRTHRAEEAIGRSEVVGGYTGYLELIADLTTSKELIASGMTHEVERCRAALERAVEGKTVALVSSGDPGIYGMAGLVLEMAWAEKLQVQIEIIPGVTSAGAAAAALGAPLMLDYATISLSDILVPWETIRARLEAVAAADLVVALYNPKSRKRTSPLEKASAIFRKYRPDGTPVGIASEVGRDGQRVILTDLAHFLEADIGMKSVVIIGNKTSKSQDGRFITPRGYKL